MKIKSFIKIATITIILVGFLLPIYWMLNVSFTKTSTVEERNTYFPPEPTIENFIDVTSGEWLSSFLNSVGISLGNVALCLLVGIPAAYVFSRHTFMADKHLFFWLLVNRMAPPAVFVIPYFVFYSTMGLYDTVLAVILSHTLFNLPLTIWLLKGFMDSVPREIDECAFSDGHNLSSFFRKIFLPLIKPGIAITAFFVYIFSWTEMLLASAITMSAGKPFTVQVMIANTSVGYGVQWGQLAAAGVISIIPGLFFLIFAGRELAKGFTLGKV